MCLAQAASAVDLAPGPPHRVPEAASFPRELFVTGVNHPPPAVRTQNGGAHLVAIQGPLLFRVVGLPPALAHLRFTQTRQGWASYKPRGRKPRGVPICAD